MHLSTLTTVLSLLFTGSFALPTLSTIDLSTPNQSNTTSIKAASPLNTSPPHLSPRAPYEVCKKAPWIATSPSPTCDKLNGTPPHIRFGMGTDTLCLPFTREPNLATRVFWGDCAWTLTQVMVYEGKECAGKPKMNFFNNGQKKNAWTCHDDNLKLGGTWGSMKAVRKF